MEKLRFLFLIVMAVLLALLVESAIAQAPPLPKGKESGSKVNVKPLNKELGKTTKPQTKTTAAKPKKAAEV